MKRYVTPTLVCKIFYDDDVVRTSEQNPVGLPTTDDYFKDEWWTNI